MISFETLASRVLVEMSGTLGPLEPWTLRPLDP